MLSILSGMSNPAKPDLTDDEGGTDEGAGTVDAADAPAAAEPDPSVTGDAAGDDDTTADDAAAGADTDSGTADASAPSASSSSGTASSSSGTASSGSGAARSSGAAARSTGATSAPKKVLPPKAKAKSKVAAGNSQITPSRHTPSQPTAARRPPSPRWVPVLMFALWAVGLLLIVLNYMGVLPGAEDAGNGWYLVAGLVSILGGIMVATQYH
jgi:hypothetical protein